MRHAGTGCGPGGALICAGGSRLTPASERIRFEPGTFGISSGRRRGNYFDSSAGLARFGAIRKGARTADGDLASYSKRFAVKGGREDE